MNLSHRSACSSLGRLFCCPIIFQTCCLKCPKSPSFSPPECHSYKTFLEFPRQNCPTASSPLPPLSYIITVDIYWILLITRTTSELPISPLQPHNEVGNSIVPILQMRSQRHRDVKVTYLERNGARTQAPDIEGLCYEIAGPVLVFSQTSLLKKWTTCN